MQRIGATWIGDEVGVALCPEGVAGGEAKIVVGPKSRIRNPRYPFLLI